MRVIKHAAIAALVVTGGAVAQGQLQEIDEPASSLEQVLAHQASIPAEAREVRVVRATIEPHTIAGWHTHPTPVYVYVTKGELEMEVEGKPGRTIRAGEAVAEPLNAPMRVINRGAEPVDLVVFQISPSQERFLEENRG